MTTRFWRTIKTAFAPLLGLLLAATALAQTGGDYDLEWSVVGSAGDQVTSGGGYQIGFSLAQDQAPGISAGGNYQIVQGYWQAEEETPVAVTLAGFWIEVRGDTLVACWETTFETDVLGFNLYRSHTDQPGDYRQLNAGLIPAQAPGSPVGASYEWADAGAEPGRGYFYLLEAVDTRGRATEYGPVEGRRPYSSYLPIVRRNQ